jgi:hypothetical protein
MVAAPAVLYPLKQPDESVCSLKLVNLTERRDAMDCSPLYDRGSRVRFPAGAGNFSLQHRIQNGSGAHPVSYPMGTRGTFPGVKAARA